MAAGDQLTKGRSFWYRLCASSSPVLWLCAFQWSLKFGWPRNRGIGGAMRALRGGGIQARRHKVGGMGLRAGHEGWGCLLGKPSALTPLTQGFMATCEPGAQEAAQPCGGPLGPCVSPPWAVCRMGLGWVLATCPCWPQIAATLRQGGEQGDRGGTGCRGRILGERLEGREGGRAGRAAACSTAHSLCLPCKGVQQNVCCTVRPGTWHLRACCMRLGTASVAIASLCGPGKLC